MSHVFVTRTFVLLNLLIDYANVMLVQDMRVFTAMKIHALVFGLWHRVVTW